MSGQVAISFPVGVAPEPDRGEMTPDERKVYEALWHGAQNARQIPAIAEYTGIPKRQVQSIVETLIRVHHIPIGTSMSPPHGNFIITDAEELRRTVELLRTRGISNLVRAAGLLGIEFRLYLGMVQTELDLEAAKNETEAP